MPELPRLRLNSGIMDLLGLRSQITEQVKLFISGSLAEYSSLLKDMYLIK